MPRSSSTILLIVVVVVEVVIHEDVFVVDVDDDMDDRIVVMLANAITCVGIRVCIDTTLNTNATNLSGGTGPIFDFMTTVDLKSSV